MKKLLGISLIASLSLLTTINANASSSSCTSNDCKHIAEAIYHEARGEGKQGMIAVGNVIMNRSRARKLTPAQVVQQRGQFSYRTNRNLNFKDKKSYEQACLIANQVLTRQVADNTNGATYFGTGRRGKGFKQTAKIGRHFFYSGRN